MDFLSTRPAGADFNIISNSIRTDISRLSGILSFLSSEGYIAVENNIYFPSKHKP